MRYLVVLLALWPCWSSAQKKGFHFQAATDSLSVQEVLNLIHRDGSLLISYDPEAIPDRYVLISEGKVSMLDLLKKVTADIDLEYDRIGKNYILRVARKSFYTLSGHVIDSQSGERLIGALIKVSGLVKGVVSNAYGFFSIDVPIEEDEIEVSFLGYESQRFLVPEKDQALTIRMKESVSLLETVVVESKDDEPQDTPQFGHVALKAGQFNAPVGALGERDVMRQLQQVPGVAMASESSSGFSVRGARPNQNLILLDEAVVYNPTHFIGFFSVFNADALNKVDLFKGHIPARFGGRLASVTSVMMKEGNNQRYSVNGNINFLASSLAVEGPLKKDGGSFILSARRSYADLLVLGLEDIQLSFLDLNFKTNVKLGKKDRVFISAYRGEDRFRLPNGIFRFGWGNSTFTTRWNHVFHSKLFLNTSYIFSVYEYSLRASAIDLNLNWESELGSQTLKTDFNYFVNNRTQFNFGVHSTFHRISPAFLSIENAQDSSVNVSTEFNKSFGLENSLYLELEQKVHDRLNLLAGLRFTTFHNIGAGTELILDDSFELIGSIDHRRGAFYNSFWNVEPRISLSQDLGNAAYLKLSYNRAIQYITQASNSLSGTPLDVWFLSSPNVKPQIANQVSSGYFKRLQKDFEFSAEVFFRHVNNEIDFKDNAELLLNEELERELRIGTAVSYGIELSLSKNAGKLTGNANATFGRSRLNIPNVNRGISYASTYDRPFNFSLSPTYRFDPRRSLTLSWLFFNGLPFTSPTGRFTYGNVVVPSYTQRNADRLPNYHRLDVSFEMANKIKPNKRFRSSWTFSVYNAYNRANANAITFQAVEGSNQAEAVKFTVFGIVPSIGYRFKF